MTPRVRVEPKTEIERRMTSLTTDVSTNTRGHPLKLMLPESRVNARAHAFPVRVITVWNRLPTHVVLAPSLLSFKNSLKMLI